MMLIDDLSVRLVPPDFTAIERQPGGYNLIWNSMPSKSYTILFSSTLSTECYLDTAGHQYRRVAVRFHHVVFRWGESWRWKRLLPH